MKMLKVSLAAMSMLAVAGCGNAEASDLDPSEPLHCIIALELNKQGAKELGYHEAARQLEVVERWYFRRIAHLPESERSFEVFGELETRLRNMKDSGQALRDECLKQYAEQRRSGSS